MQYTIACMGKHEYPGVVVFDLDGTLVDTIADIAAAANRVLHRLGFASIPADNCREMVGWGTRVLAQLALEYAGGSTDDESVDQLEKMIIDEYTDKPFVDSTIYAGIETLLDRFRDRDIILAVCTNKSEPIAQRVVHTAFGTNRFGAVIGACAGREPKPSAQPLYECITMSGGHRDSALLIGDSDVDVRTARAAGVPVYGAAWGYRGRTHLEIAGADEVFDSPEEILNSIEKLALC